MKPGGDAVEFGGLSVSNLARERPWFVCKFSESTERIKFPPSRLGLRKASQPIITVLISVIQKSLSQSQRCKFF